MKYRDENGKWQELYLPPTGDTLPIGTVVDYDGDVVPYGYEKVDDPNENMVIDHLYITKVGKMVYVNGIYTMNASSVTFSLPYTSKNVLYFPITGLGNDVSTPNTYGYGICGQNSKSCTLKLTTAQTYGVCSFVYETTDEEV